MSHSTTTAIGEDHEHDPNVAHHFESMQQQTDACKLAMWVFLATEILMFGGLFCAYSVWRAHHYDIFETGHVYLNTILGAVNTVILIASSFTMAWGVGAAQLNKQKFCTVMLALTILGGVRFMCIKYVEYTTKLGHHMGPGKLYGLPAEAEKIYLGDEAVAAAHAHDGDTSAGAMKIAPETPKRRADKKHYHGPPLYDESVQDEKLHELAVYLNSHGHTPAQLAEARPFFSIYFALTGLHGLHVLIGMALVGWAMVRSHRGDFSSKYNAPVDIVGLYWHLVDLIWIFLFPLLYLI